MSNDQCSMTSEFGTGAACAYWLLAFMSLMFAMTLSGCSDANGNAKATPQRPTTFEDLDNVELPAVPRNSREALGNDFDIVRPAPPPPISEVAIGPFEPLEIGSLDEGSFAPVRYNAPAYRDPESGELAWPAHVCRNPQCDGQRNGKPRVFSKAIKGVKRDAQGRLIPPEMSYSESMRAYAMRCPACKEKTWVESYDLPQVAERRRLLKTELDATRVARRKARIANLPVPESLRTPSEIMNELLGLPRLYLFPEQ